MTVPFLLFVVSLESWYVRPELVATMLTNPVVYLGIVIILISAAALVSGLKNKHEMRAFLGGNFLIIGMLATGGAALFPVMLHSTLDPANSMTAYNSAAGPSSLAIAAIWWPIAFILTCTYFIFISRHYYGKVSVKRDNQGYY